MKPPVDMNKKIEIAKRLKKFRKEIELTQASFADSIDITRSHYNKIESEKIKMMPSKVLLKKICNKYNLNFEWLYNGNGSMQTSPVTQIQKFNETHNQLIKQSLDFFHLKSVSMFEENLEEGISEDFAFYNNSMNLIIEITEEIKSKKGISKLSSSEIDTYIERFKKLLKKN